MSEALDLLRHARDLDRQRVVAGRQRLQQLLDRGAIFPDQRALGAALRGATEDIERRAAQALEPGEQLEQPHRPRAEFLLEQLALVVAPGDRGRREMEVN